MPDCSSEAAKRNHPDGGMQNCNYDNLNNNAACQIFNLLLNPIDSDRLKNGIILSYYGSGRDGVEPLESRIRRFPIKGFWPGRDFYRL